MMFPELFAIKRAFKPAVDSWRAALLQQRAAIAQDLMGGESRIDEFLDLKGCSKLLDRSQPVGAASLKTKVLQFGKQMLKENQLAHTTRGLFPSKPMAGVNPVTLFVRIVMLREATRNDAVRDDLLHA